MVEFAVKLIRAPRDQAGEAGLSLSGNCTYVDRDVFIFEGDEEVLRDDGVKFTVLAEGVVGSLGDLSPAELIKLTLETFDFDKTILVGPLWDSMPATDKQRQEAEEEVKIFNEEHKVGEKVRLAKDDGSEELVTISSPASVLGGHTAVGWFEEIRGCYKLDRASAIDTSYEETIVCPYCGNEDDDYANTLEGLGSNTQTEEDCPDCGRAYKIEVEYTVQFTTRKIRPEGKGRE